MGVLRLWEIGLWTIEIQVKRLVIISKIRDLDIYSSLVENSLSKSELFIGDQLFW